MLGVSRNDSCIERSEYDARSERVEVMKCMMLKFVYLVSQDKAVTKKKVNTR
jgi:hypothetical protein